MSTKLFEFESKQEKYIFFGIIGVLLIMGTLAIYPVVKAYSGDKLTEKNIVEQRAGLNLGASKTPKEYYNMFQCSCCGSSIDKNCCGMAKQRKAYVDNLLLEGLEENEVVYQMVKKFGFDVLMEPSKEQEIKDYIKSQAPDNPSKIEIENPKYNFGTISQADGIVSTIFVIENSGGSDLIIENIDTSCMCTTANLIYKGEESPKSSMTMHGENPEDYSLTIPPGDSAQLKVYYDPMAHGKQKKQEMTITREVTIISNDPIDFQKKVSIELTQVY